MTMRQSGFYLLIGIIGLVLAWLSGLAGWWWVTTIVGLLIGILVRPAWLVVLVSLTTGGLGWGLPLALLAFNAPAGRIATAVESAVGLTATGGTIIILLTVALGCLLSVLGAWVGIATRRLPVVAAG
jgi:hypothetical protein